MPTTVTLVGTSHVYQWADANSDPADIARFSAFLEKLLCSSRAVCIAEEMSLDSLALHGRQESSVAALCNRLRIRHEYCDPSAAEQVALGIINEGNILLGQHLHGWTDSEVGERIAAEHRKRERVWLSRLQVLSQWPAIFVCGSEHVSHFAHLLAESKITVNVAAENWCA
jgi:hypothetical protein